MMERREFLKQSCLACLAAGVSGVILQGCGSVHWAAGSVENDTVALRKAEFAYFKKGEPATRQWVLLKTEALPLPIGVFRSGEDEYAATYLECTHQQCELAPEGDHLQCPCHGSEFSGTGKLQRGPAEADLKRFGVTIDEDHIYIMLK
jgi:Rieske Fe-S protein